jgi:dipeptidyl-peptidase-3
MAIGYICPCCGESGERPEDVDAAVMFMCAPCGEQPKNPPPDMTVHTIPTDTPVVELEATAAFGMLTQQEQAYAFGLGRADWEGAKICLLQCSAESTPIFSLLQLVFSAQPVAELAAAATAAGLSDDELAQALMYAASFYGNLGNYKSFGDTKFVPELPAERFKVLLTAGRAEAAKVEALWDECCARMYSLPPRQRQMGLGAAKGISTYFSANCDEGDAELGNRFLDSIGLSAYNTRLFKDAEGKYTVRIASSLTEPSDDPVGQLCKEHTFEGKTFAVTRGDYAPLMARVAAAIKDALPHVANEQQEAMLNHYITSFTQGSINAHKDASRSWIRDIGPSVESYIGFIESYRDPSGVRGEWEGFVSCVNKEVSAKFQVLVDRAETFLEMMPWTKEFEKDTFLRPDFTSLEVLSFGSSGVPAGINIPNYDDIRQSEGFKNVSLGNVLQASYGAGDKRVTLLSDSDQDLFKKLKGDAFEVQVGIHELLGHGSGKLYEAGTPDAEQLVATGAAHPLTGEPITGPFYAPGTTWDSTFGKIASTYEECRAECSGLYLSLEEEVLKVFGHEETASEGSVTDVTYINWLLMARAGLTGLEFYTPETKGWRQAHMQARYVILRVLLEAGEGLVELKQIDGADGKPDLEVLLARDKISTVGKETIGAFLLKLQIHKSLGDLAAGSTMYNAYSEVPEQMIALREIVMARKEPRKLLIQPHMHASAEKVELQTFASTPTGMIESFVAVSGACTMTSTNRCCIV